jgi:hypothetical protein
LAGSPAEAPGEGPPHNLGTLEAAESRNFFKTCCRRLKLAPRRFKTKILDMHSRRLASFLREQPGKVCVGSVATQPSSWG